MLICGYSITDIAKKINVSRTTIYNWLNDFTFNAELNKLKNELNDRLQNQRLNVLTKTMTVIEKYLNKQLLDEEEIDIKTALKIIQILPIIDRKEETDPERLRKSDDISSFLFG